MPSLLVCLNLVIVREFPQIYNLVYPFIWNLDKRWRDITPSLKLI